MITLTLLAQKINLYRKDESRSRSKDDEFRLSEAFWFTTSFILFLILGPFSALAVLFGVISLAKDNYDNEIDEPFKSCE